MAKFHSLDAQLEALHQAMRAAPGYFFVKDNQGRYLYMNDNLRRYIGSCAADLIGRKDFEFPWGEFADLFRQNDSVAKARETCVTSYEAAENDRGVFSFLVSHKEPFYHNGSIIGVCGTSIKIDPAAIQKNVPFSQHVEFVDTRRCKKLSLTYREKELLFWLLQGYSLRDIAFEIGMGSERAKYHLEAIKAKNEYTLTRELVNSIVVI